MCSSLFPYIQLRSPAHDMVTSTVKVGLLTTVNMIQTVSPWHTHRLTDLGYCVKFAQRFSCWALLSPVKLMININHHKQEKAMDHLMGRLLTYDDDVRETLAKWTMLEALLLRQTL